MLTKLKQKIQQALSSEAMAAHKIGLTPNIVSVIGFVLSFLAAAAYALTAPEQRLWLLVGVLLLMASGFCDTLDGILARTYGQATPFGGFFDSLLDRFADFFVLSGVIISGLCNLAVGLAALASSFMVSYSRARAEAAGVKMESVGLAERPERIIILAAASLAAIFWLPALNIGIIVIAALATFTVLQRGLHAYKELKRRDQRKEQNEEQEKPNVKIIAST
ncbi:MAG: archaetidylinositol phosphate synthase [Candidatus Bathyarchaeota archaeon]|nr:archaetidylinositol phosphate synthase [Candidatus Bathyarchaeota archaeon]